MQITFDIETIPSQQPEAKAAVLATIKPPATLKKPESIAAWWDNESAAAVEDAYRKQSFDALHGEIISIAAAGGRTGRLGSAAANKARVRRG